jgi:hypothetical protein
MIVFLGMLNMLGFISFDLVTGYVFLPGEVKA